MQTDLDIASLIPHRAPMLLLDRVVDFDPNARTLAATFVPRVDSLFYEPALGGVRSAVALEYMAQAAAALVTLVEQGGAGTAKDVSPRAGFLLGTRNLALHAKAFAADVTHVVRVTCDFEDSQVAAFSGTVAVSDQPDRALATATFTAARHVRSGDDEHES